MCSSDLGLGLDDVTEFELDENDLWVHRLRRPIPDTDAVRSLRGYLMRQGRVSIVQGPTRFEGPAPKADAAADGAAAKPARRRWFG